MKKTSQLRALILDPKLLVMPGAHDVISGRLIEKAGFKAAQASGANIVACHYGVPDYSFISAREMAEHTGRIARALAIPVMADGDTGFGNAVNTFYTVREFERCGAAGINIEDQVMPKRCGHLEGKSLLPLAEAIAKIRACVEAREDPDFVINARTDALAVEGIEGVVRRGNAYLDAGATMVFVEGINSVENITAAVRGIRGPVGINLVEGGKSPATQRFDELERIGVARVSLPSTVMQSAIHGIQTVLSRLTAQQAVGGYSELLAGFGVAQRLVGLSELHALEERLLKELKNNPES
jgi:2-methylisocitrate lyase-like PEP mutase family enzyme